MWNEIRASSQLAITTWGTEGPSWNTQSFVICIKGISTEALPGGI